MLRPLTALLLLAACATPAKLECACSCPEAPKSWPAWPEYVAPPPQQPPSLLGLPACGQHLPDGGFTNFCIIPAGAL